MRTSIYPNKRNTFTSSVHTSRKITFLVHYQDQAVLRNNTLNARPEKPPKWVKQKAVMRAK